MDQAWVRRPVMGVGVFAMALLLLVTIPVWLPVLLVVDLVRGRFRCPLARFTGFGLLWSWLETVGLVAAMAVFAIGKGSDLSVNYRLQRWWTRNLMRALKATVGVRIEVEGASAIGDGPFIALCRHASLADSLMSAWVLAEHVGLKPRYVLKKELQLDPCLDVVGHRLPNYFLDRSSANVSAELRGIEQMADGLAEDEVAVIFPEGTRANPQKRSALLQRLQSRSPQRAQRLQHLQYLLPPKPAGAAALLAAVPHAKVITMWHSGFDGLDTFGGIVHHLARRAIRVHVKIIEHHRSAVGTGEAFVEWLDTQWVAMDTAVAQQLARFSALQQGDIHV